MSRKVVNVTWFGSIGFVSTVDLATGEHQVYVGKGEGFYETGDINRILNWGVKMSPSTAAYLHNHLSSSTNVNEVKS